MKRLMAAIATILFAAGVSADDVYNAFGGFAPGTQQLSGISFEPAAPITAMQPGVGDSVTIYGEFQDGNSNLFQWSTPTAVGAGGNPPDFGRRPDIYQEFGGSSEVQF